ncbi:hypothetical protein SUGI_0960650 [Cryptomeria japonica]|nr:hypothetical protein SUGI_0960650 [Cryptomeria japonica]
MRYQCRSCPNFTLHEACATLPDLYVHPDNRKHPYEFHSRTGTLLRHHCCRCRQVIRGFVFESRGEHLKLHPLCMLLPADCDVAQLPRPSRGKRVLKELSHVGNSVAEKLLDRFVSVPHDPLNPYICIAVYMNFLYG